MLTVVHGMVLRNLGKHCAARSASLEDISSVPRVELDASVWQARLSFEQKTQVVRVVKWAIIAVVTSDFSTYI